MPVTIDGTNGVSLVAANGVPTAAIQDDAVTIAKVNDNTSQLFGMRNRIINGAMEIDQRNNGTASTPTGDGYHLDRFRTSFTNNTKFTVQQNYNSVTPPPGFVNYWGMKVNTAVTSLAASDVHAVSQLIEGRNVSDLDWGTATAKTITLSFWVYSNVTGVLGGAISNSGVDRSYPFSYAVNSANTWEYKTITIPGDTGTTWLKDSGTIGMRVWWNLGCGSNYLATAGSWGAGDRRGPTGATNIMGSTSNVWYLTGVQLEVGSVATPFEKRLYSLELALCQRYLFRLNSISEVLGISGHGSTGGGTGATFPIIFPVQMRAAPTLTVSATTDFRPVNDVSYTAFSALSYSGNGIGGRIVGTTSGLSNGVGVALLAVNSTGWMNFNAEL